MYTLKIELPQNIIDELQRTDLELNARRGVIDRYFEKHINDTDASALDSVPFNHFMTLLAEAETKFELLKNALSESYVPDFLQEHEVEWNVDYSTRDMTITVKCDCFIPELEEK